MDLRVQNFIEGCWRPVSSQGDSVEKFSPRDGRRLFQFGAGHAKDVDEAVASARRAFEDGRWSKLPLPRRKEALYRLAALIDARREELALLESLDVGKPISDAIGFDIPAAAGSIRFSAEAADKFYSHVYGADASNLSYQLRRPFGVVATITPWNFPFLIAAAKIGPALSAGNSVVLKPSEVTSLSSARLAELAIEAGVPEGVFNVVVSSDVTTCCS